MRNETINNTAFNCHSQTPPIASAPDSECKNERYASPNTAQTHTHEKQFFFFFFVCDCVRRKKIGTKIKARYVVTTNQCWPITAGKVAPTENSINEINNKINNNNNNKATPTETKNTRRNLPRKYTQDLLESLTVRLELNSENRSTA